MSSLDKFIKSSGTDNKISVINDPFKRDAIQSISMHIDRRLGTGDELYCWGIVNFRVGDTTGSQRFEAKDFDDLVLQIKNCIANL